MPGQTEVYESQEEGYSTLTKVGCGIAGVGASCGAMATVLSGIGCVGTAAAGVLAAGLATCAGVGTTAVVAGYSYLNNDSNTTEMTVAPAVKYAPGGVLNCREKPTTENSPVVETFKPGETVTVDLNRPKQGDWAFTPENCWVASELAGVPYLTPTAE